MFATIGLFILNFPMGRIFMGDAGAYSLGFILGWMIIFLMHRQPEISHGRCLVIFWPVMDTVFAIGRRRFANGRTDKPDRLHFHQLIMRFWEIMSGGKLSKKVANPLATATILPLAALPVVGGVIFIDQPLASFFVVAASCASFWLTYSLAMLVIRRRLLRHLIGRLTAPVYGLFLDPSINHSQVSRRHRPIDSLLSSDHNCQALQYWLWLCDLRERLQCNHFSAKKILLRQQRIWCIYIYTLVHFVEFLWMIKSS